MIRKYFVETFLNETDLISFVYIRIVPSIVI